MIDTRDAWLRRTLSAPGPTPEPTPDLP
jgi:hypothetical protein